MMTIVWTRRAVDDVRGIRSFIEQDSPHYASLVSHRIVSAVERLARFPESGRVVPEVQDPDLREVIHGPYRIVYRFVQSEVHIITVHHSARMLRIEP